MREHSYDEDVLSIAFLFYIQYIWLAMTWMFIRLYVYVGRRIYGSLMIRKKIITLLHEEEGEAAILVI